MSISEREISAEVEKTLTRIDEHTLCSGSVPRSVTVQFYEELIDRLQTNLAAVREDMENDDA